MGERPITTVRGGKFRRSARQVSVGERPITTVRGGKFRRSARLPMVAAADGAASVACTWRIPPGAGVPSMGVGSESPDQHLDRLASLEQELDDLYGHLGLPKPGFGELSVRRVKRTGRFSNDAEHRAPERPLRRTA
jgi:hypothetical protein